LSPYLHFGHISAHEIFHAASSKPEFIDELVTWRELGFNMCAKRNDYDAYESLPEWAQRTLAKHAADRRPWLYTARKLEQAKTHDPLWNAAQRQLLMEGRIEPYLRMLWGKKILEWSPTPQRALAIMIDLNNKYALDGRDPNSYNGIMWVLGRYDRPWGPERPIFGTVRYMSSQNTARKMPVKEYIEKYAG
jgi:deoxyribodipyrimidine photo-lyase